MISLSTELAQENNVWFSKKIALNRTAREILKGELFIEG